MAREVRGLSPRPRPRPGPGFFLDRSTGLDPELRVSVSASNCIRTDPVSRVTSVRRRRHRTPFRRSPQQLPPPARPRSPTPRAGRRSASRKPGHQRQGSAQCGAQAVPVAKGDCKTLSRSARCKNAAQRASGRIPGERGLLADAPDLFLLPPRSRPSPRPLRSESGPTPLRLEPQTSLL